MALPDMITDLAFMLLTAGFVTILFKKINQPLILGYILAGLRVGYTAFEYDIDGPLLTDPVWGGEAPFHFEGIKSHAWWGELLVGVRAQIYKNLHMGWTFRYKVRFSVKNSPNAEPWYIPGFGENDNTRFGATYDLVYCIPYKK